MKNVCRKFVSFVLAFTLCFGFFGETLAISAAAKDYCYNLQYDSLDDIKEDIKVFKTISNGKISAVKKGGSWYYQFKDSNGTVRINAKAFTKKPTNKHLKVDNDALNNYLSQAKENYSRVCYYNTIKTKSINGVTTYTVTMYRFDLEVGAGSIDSIVGKAKLTHGVTFTYSNKVLSGDNISTSDYLNYRAQRGTGIKYVTPTTDGGYLAALKRSSSVESITPVITVSVNNKYKGHLFFSDYQVSGMGQANTSVNINKLIGIVTATKSTISNAVSKNYSGTFKSLYDLVKNVVKLQKKTSQEYNTGERKMLQKNSTYVLRAKFESPFKLYKGGHWFQTIVYLGDTTQSINKKYSDYYVNFKFK